MKILWILAHPDPHSLNASLMRDGLRGLAELGHEGQVSDLYAMGWQPLVEYADAGGTPADCGSRPGVGAEQERAYRSSLLSENIVAEQQKIAWADALVVQFPMWWFGPPAILKGWLDRVLVQGFAFGLSGHDGRTLRYGERGLAGKRALLVTTVGARESGFGPRGIHGHVNQVLWPLLHGTFWYTGMAALPPFVVYGADRLTRPGYREYAQQLRDRLRTLPTAEPLCYRPEIGGDYDPESLELQPWLAPSGTGLGIHEAGAAQAGAAHAPVGPEAAREGLTR